MLLAKLLIEQARIMHKFQKQKHLQLTYKAAFLAEATATIPGTVVKEEFTFELSSLFYKDTISQILSMVTY